MQDKRLDNDINKTEIHQDIENVNDIGSALSAVCLVG